MFNFPVVDYAFQYQDRNKVSRHGSSPLRHHFSSIQEYEATTPSEVRKAQVKNYFAKV
jgi:hypothetical protein